MLDALGVMGDLGGGSLELVAVLGNGSIGASSTLPIGPLRSMSSGRSDPRKTVVEAIEGVRWLREETGKTFYAVGAPGGRSRACTWSRRAIRCISSIISRPEACRTPPTRRSW